MIELISRSPNETRKIGEALSRNARPGQIFLLFGELGAGKTCLTQGILWGLGAEEYARSPTFVMVAEHDLRLTVYHIDLYRLEHPKDILEIGLDEYLDGNGLVIIEWADREPSLLSEDALQIWISSVSENKRRIRFVDPIEHYSELLSAVDVAHRVKGRRQSC